METSIIAMLVAIVGGSLTVVYLFSYLRKKEKVKLRNAALTFIASVVLFFTLVTVAANQYPDALPKKEVVLIAAREASLGGILLRLYADSTFELGNNRRVTSTGVYNLNVDTLVITTTDNSKLLKDISQTSFIIEEENLVEVNNTGIKFLEIHENRLK
ncbi:copper resistance protein NlpE [Pontibacter pamirensis]|uniref:copper resistance protein NlpE n=1 Tax=Pontibacter pamirensis TaxID=2562824 RepID=UPI00138A5A28|nr:copper resistance protein NlpE [Pontibacter pamirensis]